jgi:hypothetical protein
MPTIEEMDAEAARMKAHLKWLKADIIAELEEFLDGETNPYLREFLEQQLAKVKAMPAGEERAP